MKQNPTQLIGKTLGIFLLSFLIVLAFSCHTAQAKGKVYGRVTVKQGNGSSRQVKVWQISQTESNVYSKAYQKKASEFVAKKKKNYKGNAKKPLLILNPYGIFSTSVYFYTKMPVKCYAECTIKASGAVTIKQVLKNSKKYAKKQEYLISNLVAGSENTVILRFYDKNKNVIKKMQFKISMKKDPIIPALTDIEKGSSREEMSEGLFAIIGHDRYLKNEVYFYDNNGVNHGKMRLYNYRADRLITVGGKLIYPYGNHKIAVINRLGRVVKRIDLGSYKMHHDLLYDKNTKKLICLVSNGHKETIEDEIISININTGKIKLLADMEALMPDVRSLAVWNEDSVNTYGGSELDWIHLNSLDLVNPGELVVSSREQSTIIKISGLYDKPEIEYLIHGGTLYDTTSFASKTLKKAGSFMAQCGQHTISVEKDKTLPQGQYYLYMYNNNYAFSWTLPFYNWKIYFPRAGNFMKEKYSYYYKYLVDENTGTYKLVQEIPLPYSRLVSGVQQYDGHITFGSGFAHKYGEYDSDGNLIRMFKFKAERYCYRVAKYNFRGFFYRRKNGK